MRIAVTGGAGYIGSHLVLELLRHRHSVLIVDDFSSSSGAIPARIAALAGPAPQVIRADICEPDTWSEALVRFRPQAMIHLAGLKDVAASFVQTDRFRAVNIGGTAAALAAATRAGCQTFLLSSSAAIYGRPEVLPIPENHPLRPVSPYGETKLSAERLVTEWARTGVGRRAVLLRYFNPAGANPALLRSNAALPGGDSVMTRIVRVAARQEPWFEIYGDTYDTVDGTALRDFIHIDDLISGHLAALHRAPGLPPGLPVNLGTGRGATVLQLLRCFELASGRSIARVMAVARTGDVAASWADASRARATLNWQARHDLTSICASAWTAAQVCLSPQRRESGIEYSTAR